MDVIILKVVAIFVIVVMLGIYDSNLKIYNSVPRYKGIIHRIFHMALGGIITIFIIF